STPASSTASQSSSIVPSQSSSRALQRSNAPGRTVASRSSQSATDADTPSQRASGKPSPSSSSVSLTPRKNVVSAWQSSSIALQRSATDGFRSASASSKSLGSTEYPSTGVIDTIARPKSFVPKPSSSSSTYQARATTCSSTFS